MREKVSLENSFLEILRMGFLIVLRRMEKEFRAEEVSELGQIRTLLRQLRGLSLEEVRGLAGYTQSYINQIEVQPISPDFVGAILQDNESWNSTVVRGTNEA